MTVSSTNREAGPYLGNDVTTSFPFTFKVFTTADLDITLIDEDGTETDLTLDSDYSITLNADQDNDPGGSIHYPLTGDPLADGETLVGVGALPYRQLTDLTNLGRFLPQVFEDCLDKLTILIQQLRESVSRSISIRVGDTGTLRLPRAAQRANTALIFDADGNVDVSAELFALAAPDGPLDALAFVQDGTGAVSRSAQDKMREVLSAEDFGVAVGNTAAANSLGLRRLRNYMRDNPLRHFEIRLPRGLLLINDAKWLHNVRSVTVKGGPTQLQNTLVSSSSTEKIPIWLNEIFLDDAGTPAGYGTQVNGYLIDTVPKDSTSVTLTTPADAANFTASTWALVYGYNQTSNGYPPSMRFFEYRRIKSVAAGVVTFYEPLENEYRSDWVDIATNSDQLFGKARILSLERTGFKMMELCELEDLEFLPSVGYVDDGTASSLGGSLYGGGCIKLIVRRCQINGYFYPTQGKNAELEDCWIRYTEVDKLIDRVTYRNCEIQELDNGPACNFLRLEGGRMLSPISTLNARNVEIIGTKLRQSTTAGQFINTASSIRQQSVKLIRPVIDVIDPRERIKNAPNQAAASTTEFILDAGASSVDDYYNNMQVSILTGTGAKQIRTISDYVGATKTATVSAAWVTQPDTTSAFRLDKVLSLFGAGTTVDVTVVAATAPNTITCAYAGVGDSVLRGIGIGSILKSTTTATKIRVSQLYYNGIRTVIEGTWSGGTPAAAEVFRANLCGQLVIENPVFVTTQDEYRTVNNACTDFVGSGNTAPKYDELLITTRNRTPSRIVLPFLFFRDKTGTSSMRLNVNGTVLGFQVYVAHAYAGASGTATLTISRPSAEGATPYTQTIDMKTANGRRMDASGASTALGTDTLVKVPPAFHQQINFTTNENLTDDPPEGYIVVEIAP